MKYTILGFQQEKLIAEGLDITDALILRTIKDMYSSASMEFIMENGIRHMWVNYTYLQGQIPIAGNKRTLMRRIDKFSDKGLILRLLKHERKGQRGNFAYISPTPKLDLLQDYEPYVKVTQGLCQSNIRVMSKLHNKDTSIRDTSIKDTTTDDNFLKIVQAFEQNGFGTINITTRDMLVDLIDTYNSEWVLDAIEVAVKSNVRRLNYVEGILKRC